MRRVLFIVVFLQIATRPFPSRHGSRNLVCRSPPASEHVFTSSSGTRSGICGLTESVSRGLIHSVAPLACGMHLGYHCSLLQRHALSAWRNPVPKQTLQRDAHWIQHLIPRVQGQAPVFEAPCADGDLVYREVRILSFGTTRVAAIYSSMSMVRDLQLCAHD